MGVSSPTMSGGRSGGISGRPTKLRLRTREAIAGYLFLLPWLIGLALFYHWPHGGLGLSSALRRMMLSIRPSLLD